MQEIPRTFVLWLIVGTSLSCKNSDTVESRETTFAVQGIVTLDGMPLEHATVIYHSMQHRLAAHGMTDAKGSFALTTYVSGDGAVVGDHQVTIEKTEIESIPDPRGDPYPPAIRQLRHLNERYSDVKTSNLTAIVNDTSQNLHTFDLSND